MLVCCNPPVWFAYQTDQLIALQWIEYAMIQYISWYQDITEEETSHHVLKNPSLEDIFHRLNELDADEYPSFTLALDAMGKYFPQLFVFGGATGYSISLSQGDRDGNCAFSLLTYLNPEKQNLPASMYRCIGRTYPGIEIEERFFTQDSDLVRTIIVHFSETGHWKSGIPFTVEADDTDGMPREYDHIEGEPPDYAFLDQEANEASPDNHRS